MFYLLYCKYDIKRTMCIEKNTDKILINVKFILKGVGGSFPQATHLSNFIRRQIRFSETSEIKLKRTFTVLVINGFSLLQNI